MAFNMQLINRFKELMPKLKKEMYKGQNGRVGVIGGSKEYSGAPYFSAISSLRVGADLSYVFTVRDAAPVIKAYNPDLIVLPVLDCENNEYEIRTWISKIHSLVIGPGLGRSEPAYSYVNIAINYAKSKNIPIVIDADGLFILSSDLSLINGYQKCILTPNFMEFKRLYEAKFDEYDETHKFETLEKQCEAVKKLANELNNVTIFKKGKVDIISDGLNTITNDMDGSLKRCGGVGDLLTGTLGTFTFWTQSALHQQHNADSVQESKSPLSQPNLIAAYAASVLIKKCSQQAFDKFHRSVLALDIIDQIPEQFYRLFDQN